jgi:signal transduction histidine kinase
MTAERAGPADADHARLAELIEMVVAIASNDFARRAPVGDGTHLLDGLAAGLNMLAEEVAQRQAREQAYQQHAVRNERLIAVGQLAAGVAHELNNPAAFVLANLAAMERTLDRIASAARSPQGPDAATVLAEALREARDITRDNVSGVERIVTIVRELRNFSRIEPDRVEPIELADVVADACTLVRAEVSYRSRLEVHVPDGLRVHGDATRLTQVCTNLLLNAAQAIAEGAAASNVVCISASADGSLVRLRVSDTGTGMTAEAQHRLFEPFFTTKPRDLGTGLGLAISADIVRHHGGTLRLVETSDAGTTFEVVLPLIGAPAPVPPVVVALPTPTLVPSAVRPRVLIIDDEALLLDSYARIFRHEYELTLVGSGAEAMTLLEADGRWDAIVCDVMMPDQDGVAVHDWVVEHRPALLRTMIFCSGGAYTPRSLAFTERLGDQVLQKPIGIRSLRAAIARVLPATA